MEECILKFIKWTRLKIKIHLSEKVIHFREKEIWWAGLGANIGHEQGGKNENFERPVLILKKFNRHLFWGVPLSGKLKDNPYYYKFKINGGYSSVILSQLKTMSSKRLFRKMGVFSEDDYLIVKRKIKNFL